MPFYADLHVHSKFARATSSDSDLKHMGLWAVGTVPDWELIVKRTDTFG